MSTKSSLKKQVDVQQRTIAILEQQVVAMGDMCKIKDLTLQSLVGAMGAKVDQEKIREVLAPEAIEGDTGLYL